MRQANSYRAARRNTVLRVVKSTWGDDWAVRANIHAKINERAATCRMAISHVSKALAEKTILFKSGRRELIVLEALKEFWTDVRNLKGAYCKPRMQKRLLKQIDIDLRSARA